MAGTVMESLSGLRLAGLSAALLLALLTCFLIGGRLAPEPSYSQSILSTICVDRQRDRDSWFQVWSVADGQKTCERKETVEELFDSGISADQVVFAFQMPLRRGRRLDFSRWQQSLIGVLQMDIDYDQRYEMLPNATLELDVRLGYKDLSGRDDDWRLLAESLEERHLSCDLDPEHQYRYYCDLIPLFELGSLHHDFYLLNLRLPPNLEKQRNVGIGKLADVALVAIFQNGGFTKLWVSLKTIFFALVAALLVWFWRRVRALPRKLAPVERRLFLLGICLSVLNLPLELLTLCFDIPPMPLFTDWLQTAFYSPLLSFWLVFAGERLMVSEDSDGNRLAAYRKYHFPIVCGCFALMIFHTFERGWPLVNPFHSIWGTRVGANLALGFIVLVSVSACLYFCFLCWMLWRAFCDINVKRQALPSTGVIKVLMLVTLICAAMTVIGFILGQAREGQWKWNADINVSGMATVITGVYGMWNVYTLALLYLYAPAHKHLSYTSQKDFAADGGAAQPDGKSEKPEFSRLAPASDVTSLAQLVHDAEAPAGIA